MKTNNQTTIATNGSTFTTAPTSTWTSVTDVMLSQMLLNTQCYASEVLAKAGCLATVGCNSIYESYTGCWRLYSEQIPQTFLPQGVAGGMPGRRAIFLNRNSLQAGCSQTWQMYADFSISLYGMGVRNYQTVLFPSSFNMSQILRMCQVAGESVCKVAIDLPRRLLGSLLIQVTRFIPMVWDFEDF
jgi:hypothetical protein